MKLFEALQLIQTSRPAALERARYFLACSSTPLHPRTFLHAYLLARCPGKAIEIDTSRYGDLPGALEDFDPAGCRGIGILLEWYDLDPRLGYRRLGGWSPAVFPDILATVQAGFERLKRAIARLAAAVPVALVLPSLPLPPLEISVPAQALDVETALQHCAWAFAAWCAACPGVRLLSPAELDRISPPAERFDLRAELAQGSPYTLSHASALGDLLSRLLAPAAPLKGLITDLDDTLWSGVLGESGVAGIRFTLDGGAQIHGLYQQFLESLAARGILLAVASKNDPALVRQALARPDLLIPTDAFFPVEAHWGPKSESVARILEAWNISPDAVAFVDDSPLEIAEVQSRFPEIRCLAFPAGKPAEFRAILYTLREWFGKPAIGEEDRIRAQSIRGAAALEAARAAAAGSEAFLASLEARLWLRLSREASDQRALELINKTNQFNLNGCRLDEPRWRELLARPGAFLLTVEYTDKFGPLGRIAAVLGERRPRAAAVSFWVMSCRAFSRRIEHATLRALFRLLDVETISFDYRPTERNAPLREFFSALGIPESAPEITRSQFEARCPVLSHVIQEAACV
jgi:FkbH-like protein